MEYKIGDKVRIVKRTNGYDYPFGFTDEMASLAGQVFTIKQIFETSVHNCSINGDYHRYILTDRDQWDWHSSMFELVESSELKVGDTVRVISKGFEEGDMRLMPGMEFFIGRIFKITHVFHHSDHDSYHLDRDAVGWYWPDCTLEKVSNDEIESPFIDEEIEIDSEHEDFLKEISMDEYPDSPVLIGCSDCETSVNTYTSPIKVIL